MGQGSSYDAPRLTPDQLTHALAQRFASQSYTPLEYYCFTAVFRSLADTTSGLRHWTEATLCRFLALPDVLGVGAVLFQMCTYLGAFPLPSQAPAILTHDALLIVVTVLTRRYGVVVKGRGREGWLREVYRSLAVYDRGSEEREKKERGEETSGGRGFAIDVPEDGEGEQDEDEDEDDELVLAALDSMDAMDAFKQGEKSSVHHSIIPTDNFLKLVELLLLIAPIDAQQSLSSLAPELAEERVEELRKAAHVVVSSFGVEKHPGITYRTFNAVVSATMPHLFNGLHPLFEHFLFAKDFDLSKRKSNACIPSKEITNPVMPPPKSVADPEPILRQPGDILNLTILSQLSFFLDGNILFRRLRPLYSGNTHGFSMGSFEKQVFNWRAPTLLLVKGRILPSTPTSTRERALQAMLPPERLSPSHDTHQPLIYGAYIPTQWKHTPKTCFGDATSLLFQLAPTHDVFRASPTNSTGTTYFCKPPIRPAGLGFGSAVASQSSAQAHHGARESVFRPGAVSLHLDDGLEFGVFTHLSEGGGAFGPSGLGVRRGRGRGRDWQDRFEIEAMEVWGCGGNEVAEAQRREWAWEEREAEARRRVNLGTGDVDMDRELLRMAGVISGERSGGSV